MVVRCCWFLLLPLSFFAFKVDQADGQPNTQGFISIDCGIPAGHNYTDNITGISYTSDSAFIATGVNHNITSPLPQQSTLRSFPDGPRRNCYTLQPVKKGLKHLVRASFTYGNYDGNQTTVVDPIVFDMHIGVNLWTRVNITDGSEVVREEALVVPTRGFIWVCLVDIGGGTPFISSLEVRPLKNKMYPFVNVTMPMALGLRHDVGSLTNEEARYPVDPYDRIWKPSNSEGWEIISTKSKVNANVTDVFEAPSAVMQTAVKQRVVNDTEISDISFSWESAGPGFQYYLVLHIAELEPLAQQLNFSREISVFVDINIWSYGYRPPYLLADYMYSGYPMENNDNPHLVTMSKSDGSVLPPILNALEIYYVMHLPELATDDDDVDAIMTLKVQYGFKRNWMGDPCAPKIYSWDGLSCSYSPSKFPRIITLNLSSSGLSGEISGYFANLKAVTKLDLSNNSLTGNIPDFLADLPSLKLLKLSDNQLNGSIPSALLQKLNNGELILSTDGNPNLCTENGSCEKKKKKNSALIIVITTIISIFVVLLVVFFVWRIRSGKQGRVSSTMVKPHNEDDVGMVANHDDPLFQRESQHFTFKDLEKITRNFERDIGRGGFGIVYHGYLENGTEVAVKMRSQSSSQGVKEFLSEAQLLIRVHHRNLVSLVGYCNDGNNLALVYEYMDQGNLQEHLRGKPDKGSLNWGKRLQVVLESAQGLEYLHKGCSPPIVHRDVKSSNILLSQRFEAKLADFGLSKAFLSDDHTHVSTVVGGTLGYLDPEYYKTGQLNEKSDVYSFGVVLLELTTGQPPLPEGSGRGHISEWVRLRLAHGDITDIVDSRLQGEYDIDSAWKVVDVAMKCTAQASIERPTMANVVTQLEESLALEVDRQGPEDLYSPGIDTGDASVNSFEIA